MYVHTYLISTVCKPEEFGSFRGLKVTQQSSVIKALAEQKHVVFLAAER